MTLKSLFGALVLLLTPALAFAHPVHGDNGLMAGISHPIGGLDHLLAMLAVGLWAAQQQGAARWALPCTFVGTMLIGGLLGFEGLNLPALESGIAASVLALGLCRRFCRGHRGPACRRLCRGAGTASGSSAAGARGRCRLGRNGRVVAGRLIPALFCRSRLAGEGGLAGLIRWQASSCKAEVTFRPSLLASRLLPICRARRASRLVGLLW